MYNIFYFTLTFVFFRLSLCLMITITDIAHAMGYTPSTVSRALAGSIRVKPETREAIVRKAYEMGYERNALAANLRKGHSDTTGIIVPNINREFFSNAIGGLEFTLNGAGLNAMIFQTHERYDMEVKALETLKEHRVAGIFISKALESRDGSHISRILGGKIPVVQFDRVFTDLPGPKVVNDNFHGAYMATRQLIIAGYRKIGSLAGNDFSEAYKERLNGYRQALADEGIDYDGNLVFFDSITRETGYASAKKAIAAGCDALYSAGDFSALGAIEAARDAGLSVPKDFGIVGTGDEAFASLMNPSMSSIFQNPYEMGRKAAEIFLKQQRGEQVESAVVPMELRVRESSCR